MKKYIYISVAVICLLVSCSKDNTPLPEPYKVTSITCTKNGSSADGFSLTIRYDNSNKNVSRIVDSEDGVTYNYQYRDNKIYALSTVDNEEEVQTEYTLSGNRISGYLKYAYNPYNAYERYMRDKYTYKYSGYYWERTEMETNRLDETGKIINYKVNDSSNKFTWSNSNITQYTVASYYGMKFTYTNQAHPVNYPFRILNCIPTELEGSLIRKENFSPLNLMMGNNNKNLLEKAQWYMAPEINTYLGEYTFTYDLDNYGYVTGVYVTEHINNSEGKTLETNQYVFTLKYEYDPN